MINTNYGITFDHMAEERITNVKSNRGLILFVAEEAVMILLLAAMFLLF